MTAVKDETGISHIVSDGVDALPRNRQYALCDIVKIMNVRRGSTYTPPERDWDLSDVDEDAIPNCLACVVAVRKAVRDP